MMVENQTTISIDRDTQETLLIAMKMLSEGNVSEAAELTEQIRKTGKSEAPVLLVFAAISYTVGRIPDALTMLERAMELEPEVANYPDAAAAILLKLGRKVDGLFYLKLGTHLKRDPFLDGLIGEFFGNIKNIFDNFIENRPLETARLMLQQRLFVPAYQQLESYISISGGDAESFSLMSKASLKIGKLQAAEMAISALEALSPQHADIADLRFELAVQLGDAVSVDAAYKSLPEVDSLQRALDRFQVIGAAQTLSFEEFYKVNNDVLRRIPDIRDVEPFELPSQNSSDITIGVLCGQMSAALETFLIHLSAKAVVKIYNNSNDSSLSSKRLQAAIDDWRDISAIDDETLVEMIRYDDLSIFLDCIGANPLQRLSVLKSRVAPIQIIWRLNDGFSAPTIYDYRLEDKTSIDYSGEGEVVQLDNPLCFPLPPAEFMGRVTELRSLLRKKDDTNSRINFLVPHSTASLSDSSISVWVEILRRSEGATMAFIAPSDIEDSIVQRILRVAGSDDIIARIDLIEPSVFLKQRHDLMIEYDVLLDSMPRSNEIMVEEALWIGCPCITLGGQHSYEQKGASLFKAVGLDAYVAGDVANYIDLAVSIAGDKGRANQMRADFMNAVQGIGVAVYEKTAEEFIHKVRALN